MNRRWHVIPKTPAMCVFLLVVGVALIVMNVPPLGGTGVLNVIAVVVAALLVLTSVAGLVAPRLRDR